MRRMLRSLLLTLGLAAVLSGCGGGAPSVSGSLEEATVKGVVRVQGKPVAGGTVTFNPRNVNRPDAAPVQAPIQKDGTYEIKALVGQNYIEVNCKELLTAKNRPYAENQISVEVRSGENTLDVDIPPKS